ncbi:MAG: hypothetical protein ACM3X9_14260 [Bacillota bacterium]
MLWPFTNPTSKSDGRWVVVDLHVHSTYSGGGLTPQEILETAQGLLMDGVAIADHYQTQGAQEGELFSARDRLLPCTLVAQEISAGDHFHFLVVGGDRQPWTEIPRRQLAAKFRGHRESGGAIILAHPWTMPKNSWNYDFLKEIAAAGLLDAVELFNAGILEVSTATVKELQKLWEEWLAPNNLGVTGGSDFHHYRQGRIIGQGRTYFRVFQPEAVGIIEALRNRRCVAGLFGCSFNDLNWLGSGNRIIFGAEPWLSELKALNCELYHKLAGNWLLKSSRYQYLRRLLETGNFQMVKELL